MEPPTFTGQKVRSFVRCTCPDGMLNEVGLQEQVIHCRLESGRPVWTDGSEELTDEKPKMWSCFVPEKEIKLTIRQICVGLWQVKTTSGGWMTETTGEALMMFGASHALVAIALVEWVVLAFIAYRKIKSKRAVTAQTRTGEPGQQEEGELEGGTSREEEEDVLEAFVDEEGEGEEIEAVAVAEVHADHEEAVEVQEDADVAGDGVFFTALFPHKSL